MSGGAEGRLQKRPKNHGPQRFSQNADPLALSVPESGHDVMIYTVELYLSSDESSDAEAADPQVSVQVGDNAWRTDPSLDTQESARSALRRQVRPRITRSSRKLRFPQHFPIGIEPSESDCVELFMNDGSPPALYQCYH